ncbi:putative ABC transporter permease [Qiania dongpingensis]|uniref:Putative ABC transporter permease n=1 Tax=Qiania dongpingensis TaxID=2763669 RepID=A0A7G9G359_9FIRM|nr:putative ABC transporter permease [Qiania dongpingensis]QNM05241.1 putative ABC transporter permease [Qiania dongpingensis]
MAFKRPFKPKTKDADCNFYKIFWIYIIGGILGCLAETIWCYFAFGGYSNRSSNLFFPMSNVWGAGCALFSILLHNNQNSKPFHLFIKGYIFGGAFEFLCGFVCQIVLGVTFWDYSGIPLSIGNYVNLVFCAFWGLVAIAWAKWIYPFLSRLLEKVPQKKRRFATRCTVCLVVFTSVISCLALIRMSERHKNIPPRNFLERHLDQYYPDRLLGSTFPKMKYLDTGEYIKDLP